MKLSVIIPIYNEADTISEILRRVHEVPLNWAKEVIIVDDGSTDGTKDILVSLRGMHPELKVVSHFLNQGKGAAIRSGIPHATGDVIIVQDADLEYDPQDFAKLLEPIEKGYADVVFGNRFHGGAHRVLYFWHSIGNKLLTMLSNALTNLNLNDMEVGYKAFRSEMLRCVTIESDRFGFEPEVTAKVARMKCRIYEVPISYHGRTYEEGKKITWRDGFVAIYCIIRYGLFK
jgi:glycosyltransferase involved in cell wall biosynthesis